MPAIPLPSFQEYLTHLSVHSVPSTLDYGLYLKEIRTMRSYAQMTSTAIFLLDYPTRSYPFIDPIAAQVMGHPAEAFDEGGLAFTWFHNQDFEILNQQIFEDRTLYMKAHLGEDLSFFRFSMGYRFRDCGGNIRNIRQQHVLTQINDQAMPLGILAFVSDLTDAIREPKIFHQIEQYDAENSCWRTAISREYFPDIDEDKLLSKKELEMVKWLAEGYSSKQIADRLFLSFHTVNTHRKNMLRKTNCQNVAELIQYALRNRLI